MLVERFHKVTEGLIDDEQGVFRGRRGFVDQIFTLKQIGEKAREENVECMWVFWTFRRHMVGSIVGHYDPWKSLTGMPLKSSSSSFWCY